MSNHPCSASACLCTDAPEAPSCPRSVDDLDDINNLDEWIARSQTILLFASDKYFTSWSCQNEILSTLKWKRPFFLVHEPDPKHGGKPWVQLVTECPTKLNGSGRFGALPLDFIGADGRGDYNLWAHAGWFERVAEAPTDSVDLDFSTLVLEGQTPIMWHRLPDYQQIALKSVAEKTLLQTPDFVGLDKVSLHI